MAAANSRVKLPPTIGFAQVGQTGKTSAFVLLSSAVRADRMLRANEQIINFLFYIRLTVRADGILISHLRKALDVARHFKTKN